MARHAVKWPILLEGFSTTAMYKLILG